MRCFSGSSLPRQDKSCLSSSDISRRAKGAGDSAATSRASGSSSIDRSPCLRTISMARLRAIATIQVIGLAMVGGCAVLLFPIRRRAEKDRWHEGTITLRTVEPGPVGESGQRVDCEVALNPTGRITRAYTIAGPLDTSWLVVDATLRCLIDRYEFIVVRAFPYAQPDASLPSGRELKFSRAKART